MDNLEKLYNVLKRDGYITKSFDEFVDQATQDADYQDKIFNVVSRENLFTGGPDEFSEKYFSELATSPVEGVKKKDDSQFTSPEEVTESSTVVVEQPGSSGPSPQINPNQPEEVVDERVTEEIQDPETLQEVQQIQEVPNRTGADDVYLEDAIDTRDYSSTGEENTDLEDFFGKNFLTDFLGDIYRAGAQGQAQGGSIDESLELFAKGKDVTDEDIQDFIIAQEKMANAGQSDEMRDFNKIYQSDGGGWWGFLKGVASNPSIIPQLFVSSVSAMVNPTVIAAAGVGAGTGAAIGSTGFSAGPLGVFTTAGGAIAGAMGAAGGTLETGLTFAELLLEQLDGKPMTKKNVREILESDEKMQGIRFKSAGRGFAIGMVDAISAGIASKVTAKVAGLTGKKLIAATAGGAVEAVGGSTGEVAGRLVAGQEMDIAEIGFEGIAGTATAPITVGYGLYKAPKYYINKQNGGEVARVSGPEMAKFIREATPEELAGATLDIENDSELKEIAKQRRKDIEQDAGIIQQLQAAGITDVPTINKLVELEKQKELLSGNTTRAGKIKLKEIDAKIDDVMNGIDVDITQTTDAEGNTTTETIVVTKDYAIEKLKEDGVENPTEQDVAEKRAELIEEGQQSINELKTEDNAIQESSPESVDVQEQTINSEEVGDGDTQGDPTTEGQDSETDIETESEEEVAPETPEESKEASRDLSDLLNALNDGQNKSRSDVDETIEEETPEAQVELPTEETVVEAVTPDANGNLNIIESEGGTQVNLPGQQVDNIVSVTEKTKEKNDNHYSSDIFTEENPNTTVEQHENKIISLAKKASKAIAKLLPDTKIVIHRSEEAYNKFVTGKGTRGTFDPNTNTIHINMPKANAKTIAHEIFHALIYDKYGSELKIAEVTKRMVDSVKRKITDKKLKKELQEFSDKYTDFKNEEYLSELVGILADNYPSLSAPEKSIVRRWLEKIGKALGISPEIDTDTDVLNLLNTIGKNVKKGKEISKADLNALNEVDRLNTEDKIQQAQDKELALKERQKFEQEVSELPSGINAWLNENLGKVHVKDFDKYADPKLRKDAGISLNRLLRKTGPRDIDVISDPDGDGIDFIEPQVIIDYLLDISSTPGKYTKKNIARAREMGMTRDQKMQQTDTTPNKLANFYKMNKKGFIKPENVYDSNSLKQWASRVGLKVDDSRGDKGEITSYYLRDSNDKIFKPSKQRQQIVFTKSETPLSIVNKARDLGFNNPEIKDVLKENTDMKVSEITSLLKVPFKELKNLPESFVNIKGGVKKGLSTFKKINEFITDLNKKNQKLENPLTQEQLSTKAIEKLQTTEAYKSAADFIKVKGETKAKSTPSTQQLQMEVAIRESFDVKPTKDAAKTLRNLKTKIKDRLKGMRDIQKIKKELRNFIRQSLPNDQYTKTNVLKMVRLVTNLTSKELTGPQLKTTMLKIQNFVTERNIENLKTKKDLLLDVSKYEKKDNNLLKGKIVSADVKNRIKKIAESQPGPSMTAKEIEAQMATWNEEANTITKKGLLTDGDLSRLSDLQIMINLSNSKLMDGSDIPSIHQVSVLDAANSALESLILEGRSDLREQLAVQRKEYVKEMQDLYNDMTGNKVDLSPKKITVKEATAALKKDGITDPTDIQIADKITELQDQNIEDIQKQMDQIQKDYDINASRLKRKTKASKNPLVLLKRGFEYITTGITNFLNRAESLQGLMDIISLSPGKMLGGVAQKLVYKKINSSSIEYKGRMIMLQDKISNKMQEIYGKKWRKAARKNSDSIGTGVYRDVDAVAEAQKVYDENPNKQNQKKLDKVLLDQEIIMSPNQIYYQYNQFIDPANKKSYLSEFNFDFKNDPDRIMKELYDTLSQENKDWAQWQRDEFFPELYDHYNEVYKKIYRTDMPWNEFYSGRIYRTDAEGMGMGDVEVLNLQGNGSQFNTSVGAASTKARVDNTNPIAQMDGNDALMTYVTDMEWFAAYGENVRNISKLMGNKNIKKTIEVKHGKDMNYLIETVIDKIASRGINTSKGNTMVNTFNNIFITSRLGLNPTVMLKQLTSMPTYANSIGPLNYAKYSFKNKAEMLKVYKEVRDNSVYMKDRGFGDMKKVIESYSSNQKVAFIPKGMSAAFDYYSNFMMVTTKVADKAAIYLGGMPNYSYYKAKFKKANPNATEQQAIDYAIRKFELDTKSTQQSMDLQDKDYFQSGDPLARSFNIFMTTPKQYYRMERMAFRQLWRKTKAWDRKAGKGTLGENIRTVAMYHAVMPALFQYVALGLPGMMRDKTDEDDQDLLRSIVLGNLNALFIVGDLFTMGFDQARGKPWAETAPSLPILEMMAELNRLSNRMNKVKDPEKKAEYATKYTTKFLELTSLPASNLNKLFKNYEKLIDGNVDDPGEAFLRAFNYSDYIIEGQVTPPTKEDMDKLKEDNLKLYNQVYPAWEKEFGKKTKDRNVEYRIYKKNPKLWKQKNPDKKIPNRR